MNDDSANLRRFRGRWLSKIRCDLREYAERDGVCWPSHSLAYRLAYGLWKAPLAARLRGLFMRTGVGVRLRQRALKVLGDSPI